MVAGRVAQVLVATQAERVYEILRDRNDVKYEIALYTGTIKDLLPSAHLVVIDYEDIVEYPLSETEIREAITAARVFDCSSKDFIANPDNFLSDLATREWGKMLRIPPHYCIAFVSYSGGTGRTTLAIDTATYYAATLKRYQEQAKQRVPDQTLNAANPAMVAELTYGISSLVSLTGLEMPYLYELVSKADVEAQIYRDVALFPMDYENVRVLSIDLLKRRFQKWMDQYNLTILDCLWPHGLSSAIRERVDMWIVVASERPDTIVNAQRLYDELSAEVGETKVRLLLNQATDTKTETKGGPRWDIKLPRIARPDEFRGELGRVILSQGFSPVWQDYDQPRKVSWLK